MCYNDICAPGAPTVGMIAKSRMGHDKERLYAVIAVLNADFVLCADGKFRTEDNPKQKRFKHLKVVGKSDEIAAAIADKSINNEKIAYVLKKFNI